MKQNKEYKYKFGNAYSVLPFYIFLICVNIILICNIPLIFPIVLLLIIDFISYKIIKKNKLKWKIRNIVTKNLNFFISSNNLIDYEVDIFLFLKSYKVIYQPVIKYSFNDDNLYLKIILDGSQRCQKLADSGELLENLFSIPLKDIQREYGEITYIFELSPAKRLHISSIADISNYAYDNKITLNSNLIWDINKTPHALITGSTGSGKTFFITYLIHAFKAMQADIYILDPKRSDLSQMGYLVGEKNIAFEPNHIARVLREANEIMNSNRYDKMRELNTNKEIGKIYSDYGMKPIFIVFDEVMAFMSIADNKLAKECNGYLTSIIAKGRQAGVFMILSTQRADTDFISGAIRDQLGLRLALGTNSNEGYRMVFGTLEKEINKLSSSNGQGYIFLADGKMSQPCFYETPLIKSDVI